MVDSPHNAHVGITDLAEADDHIQAYDIEPQATHVHDDIDPQPSDVQVSFTPSSLNTTARLDAEMTLDGLPLASIELCYKSYVDLFS